MYIVFYFIFFVLLLLGVVMMVLGGKSWSFFGFIVLVFLMLDSILKLDIKCIYEMLVNIGYFLIVMYVVVVLFYYYI